MNGTAAATNFTVLSLVAIGRSFWVFFGGGSGVTPDCGVLLALLTSVFISEPTCLSFVVGFFLPPLLFWLNNLNKRYLYGHRTEGHYDQKRRVLSRNLGESRGDFRGPLCSSAAAMCSHAPELSKQMAPMYIFPRRLNGILMSISLFQLLPGPTGTVQCRTSFLRTLFRTLKPAVWAGWLVALQPDINQFYMINNPFNSANQSEGCSFVFLFLFFLHKK